MTKEFLNSINAGDEFLNEELHKSPFLEVLNSKIIMRSSTSKKSLITSLVEIDDDGAYLFILRNEDGRYVFENGLHVNKMKEITLDTDNQYFYFMNSATKNIVKVFVGEEIFTFFTAIKFYKKLSRI